MKPSADRSLPGMAPLAGEFLDRLGLADVTLAGNDSAGAITQMLISGGAPWAGRVVLASCEAFGNVPAGRRHRGRRADGRLALGEPSGLVPDLAGPRIYTVAELVNSYLSAVGKRRPLVPVHIAGQAARALRAGANLAQIAPSATGRGRNSWPTGSRAPRTSRSGAALALA